MVFHVLMDPHSTSMLTFDTPLGRCAVRWTEAGISGVLLPGAAGRSGPRYEEATDVPPGVCRAIEGMVAVLSGGSPELRDIPLDERGIDELRRAIYAATRDIPPGATRSYGEVARAIGHPGGARDVGAALARIRPAGAVRLSADDGCSGAPMAARCRSRHTTTGPPPLPRSGSRPGSSSTA